MEERQGCQTEGLNKSDHADLPEARYYSALCRFFLASKQNPAGREKTNVAVVMEGGTAGGVAFLSYVVFRRGRRSR